MKITITPNGDVTFDTDDLRQIGQALDMIKGLRNGTHAPAPKKSHKKKIAEPVVMDGTLSTQLTATWNWLVNNDNPAGMTTDQISGGLGITTHAATWRLNQLIDKGLAHRVKRGCYRPGESLSAPQPPPSDAPSEGLE